MLTHNNNYLPRGLTQAVGDIKEYTECFMTVAFNNNSVDMMPIKDDLVDCQCPICKSGDE